MGDEGSTMLKISQVIFFVATATLSITDDVITLKSVEIFIFSLQQNYNEYWKHV